MSERISVLLTEEAVDKRIKEIGEQITRDYEGKNIHLICVLKGGVFFMCELAKRIDVPVSMDFMAISSYGADTKSSGVIRIVKDLDVDYTGFEIPDEFVVGYGLDYAQKYRNLPYIGVVHLDEE